jgi:hypothetical protein
MKNQCSRGLLAVLLLLAGLPMPTRAQELVEEATATTIPWSGWWWPANAGEHVLGYRRGEPGPLVKLDTVSGKQSVAWEMQDPTHFSPGAGPWWGHCHAWAAAAVVEREPRRDVLHSGLWFRVGDLKALLSEAHYIDRAQFFGKRFNGNRGDDPADMSPFLVWDVLRRFITQRGIPIVFDLDAGPPIWSFPVYRYEMRSQPLGDGYFYGHLTLWVASFLVNPDFVGTAPVQRQYTFFFEARGRDVVPGTDRWTGASVADHPDFAWYPTERVSENPEVDFNLIAALQRQAN